MVFNMRHMFGCLAPGLDSNFSRKYGCKISINHSLFTNLLEYSSLCLPSGNICTEKEGERPESFPLYSSFQNT